MIFDKCLVIGEVCIIANFSIFFKILVNFYKFRNRLNLSVQLPSPINEITYNFIIKTEKIKIDQNCWEAKYRITVESAKYDLIEKNRIERECGASLSRIPIDLKECIFVKLEFEK